MSDHQPAPDSGATPNKPSPKLVEALIAECNCTSDRAVNLLKLCKNDLARAKRHHHLFERYAQNQPPETFTDSRTNSASPKPGAVDATGSTSGSSISTPLSNPVTDTELSQHENVSCNNQQPSPEDHKKCADGDQKTSSSDTSPVETSTKNSTTVPMRPPKGKHLQAWIQAKTAVETAQDDSPNPGVEQDNDRAQYTEWDFVLPRVPPPGNIFPIIEGETDSFSPEVLVGAVQNTVHVNLIQYYLSYHYKDPVKKSINNNVKGFPAIFYVVERGDEKILRLALGFGADPSAVHPASQLPLLVYTIISGGILQRDTTTMVSILLSYGALAKAVPSEFYSPFNQDQPGNLKPPNNGNETSSPPSWCTDTTRHKLANTSNITQRYFLERAFKAKTPSKKRRQIAHLRKADRLLAIPYFLIGQSTASELLIQKLLIHLMNPSKRPLVLCFAGPSGHGKTELARQLGALLSLPLEVVDCTVINREIELFGPRKPYVGAEEGSPVNNFLSEFSGKKCIVFFDEFEKTTKEIHQSLLLPFDNGEYRDRRSHDKINCSNTIWILATNALDNMILEFCQQNEGIFDDENDEKPKLVRQLSKQLQDGFLQQFDAPVTGRVSAFIPFLPFSPGEQAVVTHKSLLELSADLKLPIDLKHKGHEQLVGDIRLLLRKDATICSILAQSHYHRKLGARSLKAGAQKVEQIVFDLYLDQDEEIQENQEVRDYIVDTQAGEIVCHVGPKANY